jgi:hypothetical protein
MPTSFGRSSISGLRNIQTSLSNAIDFSGNAVRLPNNPRFDVYAVTGGTFANNSNWIFPTVVVNQGNHYNTANGRFTAPIAGVYVFYWTNIGGNSDGVFRYRFRINGANVRDVHLRIDTIESGSEYGTNGMRVFMTSLAINDFVQIFYQSDQLIASYPGSNSDINQYPQFSGWLLG